MKLPVRFSMPGTSCTILVVMLTLTGTCSSFAPTSRRSELGITRATNFEYEYIPHDEELPRYTIDMPSAYPAGTPAGLRGEAVRSAHRSGQCIGWNFESTPLESGLLHLKGKGCLDFLNNKLSNSFVAPLSGNDCLGSFQDACLLNSRGRIIDKVSAVIQSEESAFLFTSPGHLGNELFQRLDPYIFPLDEVRLRDLSQSSTTFSLASIKQEHIQSVYEKFMLPSLSAMSSNPVVRLPMPGQSLHFPLDPSGDSMLVVFRNTDLPACAGSSYTFSFINDINRQGIAIWKSLVSEKNSKGPVEIGPLEWESLRIEAGQPAYGKEYTGSTANTKKNKSNSSKGELTPPTPLELWMQNTIDVDKGCYLGQEGIASVLKNPRGPPRSLYQVVFEDEFNIYDSQSAGDSQVNPLENLTVVPSPGQTLYVLGSNEEITVGHLTSIAEPSSTGEALTLGLALVRRHDSILKQMRDLDLDIVRDTATPRTVEDMMLELESGGAGSGMIAPPPLDPLDGLEVIVGGTFTIGRLRMVPKRRFPRGSNMFDDVPDFVKNMGPNGSSRESVPAFQGSMPSLDTNNSNSFRDMAPNPSSGQVSDKMVIDATGLGNKNIVVGSVEEQEEEELKKASEEAEKAQAEAEAAAAEAARKAEKLELLRKRAEDAMARRKQKKQGS